jgi:hypothetical protein
MFASFAFGFLCEVVEIDYWLCGDRLEFVWSSLERLAEAIHPNVYTNLRDKLKKLTDLKASRFAGALTPRRGSESELTRFFREEISKARTQRDLEPFLEKAISPSEALSHEWAGLARNFKRRALTSLPKTQSLYPWLSCGRRLGELVRFCALDHEPAFLSIDEKVKAFQTSVLVLPEAFRAKAAWLERLAQFHFRYHSYAELSGLMKAPIEMNPELSENESYRIQLDILYETLSDELLFYVPVCPIQPSQDTIRKAPELEWDEREQQILIDGVPLDQYTGTAVQDSGWGKADFERNAWIYLQCMQNVTYKVICKELKRMKPRWISIGTVQSIRPRAAEFAERLGLPLPPPRQRGRRSRTK